MGITCVFIGTGERMKTKSGMKHAGAGMKGESRHEKRPETVGRENKAAFHAAVMGMRVSEMPKKKK